MRIIDHLNLICNTHDFIYCLTFLNLSGLFVCQANKNGAFFVKLKTQLQTISQHLISVAILRPIGSFQRFLQLSCCVLESIHHVGNGKD